MLVPLRHQLGRQVGSGWVGKEYRESQAGQIADVWWRLPGASMRRQVLVPVGCLTPASRTKITRPQTTVKGDIIWGVSLSYHG